MSVIVLAAGKGTRTELKTPKQFVHIGEKRIIEYSLDLLVENIAEVIIVVQDVDEWNELHIDLPVTIVKGGETRTASIMNGINAVTHEKVLLHDAARPLIPIKILEELHTELDSYACAYPVLKIASTIVVDHDGMLEATPDRSNLAEIQTPQAFKTDVLKAVLNEYGEAHSHIPELVRWAGHQVKHIEGSPWLFKITYEADIFAAHVYIDKIDNKDTNPSELE